MVDKLQDRITIFHGRNDTTIAYEHTERMAINSSKVKAIFNDDTHDGIFEHPICWKTVFNQANVRELD